MADEKPMSSAILGNRFHLSYLLLRARDTLHLRRGAVGATYADAVSPAPDGNDYFARRVAESNSRNCKPDGHPTYADVNRPEWIRALIERAEL